MSLRRCLTTSTASHNRCSHTTCMNYSSTLWVGTGMDAAQSCSEPHVNWKVLWKTENPWNDFLLFGCWFLIILTSFPLSGWMLWPLTALNANNFFHDVPDFYWWRRVCTCAHASCLNKPSSSPQLSACTDFACTLWHLFCLCFTLSVLRVCHHIHGASAGQTQEGRSSLCSPSSQGTFSIHGVPPLVTAQTGGVRRGRVTHERSAQWKTSVTVGGAERRSQRRCRPFRRKLYESEYSWSPKVSD